MLSFCGVVAATIELLNCPYPAGYHVFVSVKLCRNYFLVLNASLQPQFQRFYLLSKAPPPFTFPSLSLSLLLRPFNSQCRPGAQPTVSSSGPVSEALRRTKTSLTEKSSDRRIEAPNGDSVVTTVYYVRHDCLPHHDKLSCTQRAPSSIDSIDTRVPSFQKSDRSQKGT
jgi:hypothetical protein